MTYIKNTLTLLLTGLLFLAMASFVSATPEKSFLMATTTSTDNTGLLDYLSPFFTKDTGITMKWTATGTGKALKLGERCDADILLVHAPGAEKEFIDKGFGATRTEVMYNDFVIIGPDNDPAGIRGLPVIDALKKIKQQKTLFISRGDNSGTNKKEISLWKEVADSAPEKEKWYIQSGQGMLATINIASERGGYTLTDRGTYIKYEHTAGQSKTLSIQVEGGSPLKNQYSVVTLNKNNCPDTRHEFAEAFAKWIASPVAQRLIGEFRLLGKQLFTPNAQKS